MSPFVDYKHYRRSRDPQFRLLPDSRLMWLCQLVAAVLVGYFLAAAVVWLGTL